MSRSRERAWIHLDASELGPPTLIGVLTREQVRGHAVLSFEYEREWLHDGRAFVLDPRLALYEGPQHPVESAGQFGIFLDSAPDRWGRLLMERREAMIALRDGRPAQGLLEWHFLLGVHDHARLGALRFRREPDGPFVDDSELSAPPVASLRDLEHAAQGVQEPGAEAHPSYHRWLAMLAAPGSSLGGARPKASFTDTDESLWLAKFPARQDRRDVGAWEFLLHELAREARIDVPAARLLPLSSPHRTYCVKRFDRNQDGRRMFASAMTLLERRDSDDGASYLELAQLIQDQGAAGTIAADLEQLFRRVVFSVMVGNRDDHLRNHGFIREISGWRLSPAFDLNPSVDTVDHALCLDEVSTRADLATVLETAEYYRLREPAAQQIAEQIAAVARSWRDRARALDLPRQQIATMEPAFALADGLDHRG